MVPLEIECMPLLAVLYPCRQLACEQTSSVHWHTELCSVNKRETLLPSVPWGGPLGTALTGNFSVGSIKGTCSAICISRHSHVVHTC